MVAAAEASSEHPLARAVLSYARKCLRVTSSNLALALPGMRSHPLPAVLVRKYQCSRSCKCYMQEHPSPSDLGFLVDSCCAC